MRTGSMWAQRMSIIRRLGEFAKAHGPEMSRGNAPLFIVSLKPAKSSAVQRTRAPLSPMAAGEAPAQMLPWGLRGAAAENPTRRTPPMMRREPHLVCNAMGSERGRVAVRLAWVTAGGCDEIALLRKKEFIWHPSDCNALIADLGALPKTFEAVPCRAARCVAIAREVASMVRRVIAKMADGERFAALGARGGTNLTASRYGSTFNKTGRPGARGRGGGRTRFGPENSDAVGGTRGSTGLPRTTARYLGHWVAIFNSSAKLTALMRRARRAWPSFLLHLQRPWAKARHQGRFLMGTAF
ncbi:hypothetical protein, conserved in T.vivax [Trypanosoma vivax Y486]|uniref:Uncharacterized protein n=1 Tax=Trypanosoma vivax (strain Y486) TaxID=1055687 RepID=F9WP93_TRYVY|nr:hypothetical protein, conserved in T.vivax [Trypanosoma vivax Y486]|eukprot:CCD19368.1 hypothetical protein, conserved in T.vivax [Trypanosoma vivax Y486]